MRTKRPQKICTACGEIRDSGDNGLGSNSYDAEEDDHNDQATCIRFLKQRIASLECTVEIILNRLEG